MDCGVRVAAALLAVAITACTADGPLAGKGAQQRDASAPSEAVSQPQPVSANSRLPASTQDRAYDAAKQQLLSALSGGSSRQRLAALMLQGGMPGTQSAEVLVGLLLADGGRDPLVATEALNACASWQACPREQVLALTAGLATEDARLQLLRLAISEPDIHEELWEAAAQAPAYVDPMRLHWTALLEATEPLATTAARDHRRVVEGLAVAHAVAMPDLSTMKNRCPVASEVSDRVLQCRQLALLMAESSNMLTASVGLLFLRRQALSTQEAEPWNQLYRQLRWQAQLAAPLMDAEAAYPRQMARLGERGAIAWLLRQRGLPLNPPPHWQPGQPTGY